MTFWDAGEFIAAAHGFGIPHPPGTPLYVALGRGWIVALGWLGGSARAMNLLSAVASAGAGALSALMIGRATQGVRGGGWGAAAAGLTAGLMCSAWANATETEVYGIALLHAVAMVACAMRAEPGPAGQRWVLLTAYLMALAPALHLSALIAAPAAIVAASRRAEGEGGWSGERLLVLSAALLIAAGVGRMSPWPVLAGCLMLAASARGGANPTWRRPAATLLLAALGASALLILLLRARHEPALNQGAPGSWSALADVVARRQYPAAGLWPRRAPAWLQLAAIAQYADWQVAMAWGRGVFTTPARVVATLAGLGLGVHGWRALRRDAPRLALVLAALGLSGSLGVAAYLNLQAGASLGWGVLPDSLPHEARERDYFFVLAFWAWGCLAGWGALSLARRAGRPAAAVAVALVPLLGNWAVVNRSHEPSAGAARRFAAALLGDAPRGAVLFTGGDNDSYPLWYLQQVEGVRPDVDVVTLPLLPAPWYADEARRRIGGAGTPPPVAPAPRGVQWQHELTAAALARSAFELGRPVAASPALTARERALLGRSWTLGRAVLVAGGPADGSDTPPLIDRAAARERAATPWPELPRDRLLPDDASPSMLRLLDCPRLGAPWRGTRSGRDSLEVKCNFR